MAIYVGLILKISLFVLSVCIMFADIQEPQLTILMRFFLFLVYVVLFMVLFPTIMEIAGHKQVKRKPSTTLKVSALLDSTVPTAALLYTDNTFLSAFWVFSIICWYAVCMDHGGKDAS